MALNRSIYQTVRSRTVAKLEAPFAGRLPIGQCQRPLFIIGCGRSGTTIFGACLERHPQITYLHEPRDLWISCYPEADIWSRHAARRGGRLVLTGEHVREPSSVKLRRLFHFQTLKTRRPWLVEKLPINNFRTRFLSAIFPQARFLHISRDGREVARSIKARADNPRNGWYGVGDYKWKQLSALAAERLGIRNADALCTDNYERGLLEWRLSLEAMQQLRSSVDSNTLLELTYNDLVDRPLPTLRQALSFMQLEPDDRMDEFVNRKLRRRTPRIDDSNLTAVEKRIGGDALARRCATSH